MKHGILIIIHKKIDWVETKTIIALYERGLLKPIEFETIY